jgi:hypothetical protein
VRVSAEFHLAHCSMYYSPFVALSLSIFSPVFVIPAFLNRDVLLALAAEVDDFLWSPV